MTRRPAAISIAVDADADAGGVDIGVADDPGGSRTVMAGTGAGDIRISSR